MVMVEYSDANTIKDSCDTSKYGRRAVEQPLPIEEHERYRCIAG